MMYYGKTVKFKKKVINILSNTNDPHFFNDAALFYVMRLNFSYRKSIVELLDKIFPKDFNPETSIGIPIRSSDKCVKESTCLSFAEYMKIATRVA